MKKSSTSSNNFIISLSAGASPIHNKNDVNKINSPSKTLTSKSTLSIFSNNNNNNNNNNNKSAIECLTENINLLKLSTSLSMNYFDPTKFLSINKNNIEKMNGKNTILSSYEPIINNNTAENINNKNGENDPQNKPFKLQSPYGDWCAFSGGGGSGGCVITGPYEPMIVAKDEFSDESFESTEESDANIDLTGQIGIKKVNFENLEVVWAKRPALPWFPGIIIEPKSILNQTKEIKDLFKHIGASMPNNHEMQELDKPLEYFERTYFVFLFNSKKTWIWLPENKLRPFCKENDRFFMENSPLLASKYKKELEKAYKKAKKYSKNYEQEHH